MQHHHPHLHLRKRIFSVLEPYPARTFWKRFLDRAVFFVGIAGPVMSIPQILLIYGSKDASGLSPISWLTWSLFDIPWILYGIAHKERPIVIAYTFWLISNGLVFVGAVLY